MGVSLSSQCRTCHTDLVENQKLSKSFSLLFESDDIHVLFCPQCLDDLYVLHDNKLYPSKEWYAHRKKKAE
jgi:hypothetical protein